jgi:hypothetical protein
MAAENAKRQAELAADSAILQAHQSVLSAGIAVAAMRTGRLGPPQLIDDGAISAASSSTSSALKSMAEAMSVQEQAQQQAHSEILSATQSMLGMQLDSGLKKADATMNALDKLMGALMKAQDQQLKAMTSGGSGSQGGNDNSSAGAKGKVVESVLSTLGDMKNPTQTIGDQPADQTGSPNGDPSQGSVGDYAASIKSKATIASGAQPDLAVENQTRGSATEGQPTNAGARGGKGSGFFAFPERLHGQHNHRSTKSRSGDGGHLSKKTRSKTRARSKTR